MRRVARLGRDQRDRPDREGDADESERRGPFAEREAPGDRDDRRHDGGDRRDHPHAADREPAVEEGDRHHPDDAGDDPDDDVFARRMRVAVEADDRDDEHCGERVRQEHDPEHWHAACREAAEEVARAVRDGDDEPEQDTHQSGCCSRARRARVAMSVRAATL